ncbi:hypothetical protein B4N89_45345 [Embleya scabrispora]|uniref:Uncharacterized protein n=1 Tax=Embleya scabrispora TaxID=159449 RepID=A0A1T3NJ11_9ACTN|nr:hypothetical protein [Embleya scabrispora]OPC76715.1 hypothetical protein B4N89_45345 [Embleya scabrispora]
MQDLTAWRDRLAAGVVPTVRRHVAAPVVPVINGALLSTIDLRRQAILKENCVRAGTDFGTDRNTGPLGLLIVTVRFAMHLAALMVRHDLADPMAFTPDGWRPVSDIIAERATGYRHRDGNCRSRYTLELAGLLKPSTFDHVPPVMDPVFTSLRSMSNSTDDRWCPESRLITAVTTAHTRLHRGDPELVRQARDLVIAPLPHRAWSTA